MVTSSHEVMLILLAATGHSIVSCEQTFADTTHPRGTVDNDPSIMAVGKSRIIMLLTNKILFT